MAGSGNLRSLRYTFVTLMLVRGMRRIALARHGLPHSYTMEGRVAFAQISASVAQGDVLRTMPPEWAHRHRLGTWQQQLHRRRDPGLGGVTHVSVLSPFFRIHATWKAFVHPLSHNSESGAAETKAV